MPPNSTILPKPYFVISLLCVQYVCSSTVVYSKVCNLHGLEQYYYFHFPLQTTTHFTHRVTYGGHSIFFHLQSYRSLRNPNKGAPNITPMKKMVAVALFIHFWLQTRFHYKETIKSINMAVMSHACWNLAVSVGHNPFFFFFQTHLYFYNVIFKISNH